MKILTDAINLFKKGDFINALVLFEEASIIYGAKTVQANIYFVKKALNEAPRAKDSKAVLAPPLEYPVFINNKEVLDIATPLVPARMGDIDLGEPQKSGRILEYADLIRGKSEIINENPAGSTQSSWPRDLMLHPIPESTNDWRWYNKRNSFTSECQHHYTCGLSIIIPTFNRSSILDITLACLVNQVTKYPFEVLVSDDGSGEAIDLIVRRYEPLLDIKYVRQKDYGYQLCAIRNLGLRAAKYNFVAILDCDMAPNINWVNSYMDLLLESEGLALIGTRKYIDTSMFCAEDFLKNINLLASLPAVKTNNVVAGRDVGHESVDWRLEHFALTEDLRLCDAPFRFFSGGNVAFSKKWLTEVGGFDEDFTDWGGEDNEFGYRLYRSGCFFRAVHGAIAYHQEPPGKENETDRAKGKTITSKVVKSKVPYYYRKLLKSDDSMMFERPLVSIYIPAYNCESSIRRCIDSALNQTVKDLEVCVCNDGSTDNTPQILSEYLEDPRVRIVHQKNGGIGSASNAAVNIARGYYIGQLDSDDYLEPDAVEICLKEFLNDRKLVCVYASNRNVDKEGKFLSNGYNWPSFSREKLITAMIVHHFRMFTIRGFNLAGGFNEGMLNAVDYDFFLRLSSIGPFKHINTITYNRVLHGSNTSILKRDKQIENQITAANNYLIFHKIDFKCLYDESSGRFILTR